MGIVNELRLACSFWLSGFCPTEHKDIECQSEVMSICLGHDTWIRSAYKNTTWYWVISSSYYKFCGTVLGPEISVKLCMNHCILWHTPKVLLTEWQVRVWLGMHWFMSENSREVKGITHSRKERENIIGHLINELRSAWPCPDEIICYLSEWSVSLNSQERNYLYMGDSDHAI